MRLKKKRNVLERKSDVEREAMEFGRPLVWLVKWVPCHEDLDTRHVELFGDEQLPNSSIGRFYIQ